jgi:hypothetical protein
MPWKKLGRIFCLTASADRATTHMQVPAPVVLPSVIRVFFAARNAYGKSYPAYIDVDRADPTKVQAVQELPVMAFGGPGTFDDEGIMPACIVEGENALWMYYSGWNQRKTIPYHNTTGIGVSNDGGYSFRRMFDGPILERTIHEPYIAVTPWVMRDKGTWRMWYVSGIRWERVGASYEPIYAIKYADSFDGISWHRNNILSVPRRHELEACAHPTVICVHSVYHMWFCYRDTSDFRDGAGSYRIGYAQSNDGIYFTRRDELAGIEVSQSGWDSTMLCYPSVVSVDGLHVMFYNGNSFGQTGIGCAVWNGRFPHL